MKWIMYLSLIGALLFSLAAGMVIASWVTQGSDAASGVVPAVKYNSGSSVCPGQTQICPASGKRASAHLQV